MNSNRPLTAPEVRSMFAASDKADADRLARSIEREQRQQQCSICGNAREDCYCLPSS